MPEPTPIDHPISKLSFFIRHTAEWKRDVRENAETIEEGLGRPGALRDADVTRITRVYTEQQEDLALFEAQSARWAALPNLTGSRRMGLAELDENLAELRRLNARVLDAAALLERATLEQQMSASDLEWGIAAVQGQLPRM
jgi:hypothetical protein